MSSQIINTKQPKKLWLKILFVVLLILAVSAGYAGYRVWSFLNKLNNSDFSIIEKPADNENINALIIGIDKFGSRADTNIFASYNPTTGKVLVMFIPRDTQAFIPGHFKYTGKPYGINKINAAHAYRGLPLAIETVERLLNTNIHYYARINYTVLHKLVDAIGGVPIKIERYMDWDDKVGNLHIHFTPGDYVLNGQQSEEYLRWRKNNDLTCDPLGDIGRIQRQKKYMNSAINQALKLNTILNIGQIEDILAEGVTTNMTASFMFKMFTEVVMGFDLENDINIITLPGETVGNNYEVSEQNRAELDTILQKHYAPDITKTLNIRVLNGTTVNSLATDVAKKLNNYPNISATAGDNAQKNIAVSQVISYTEDNIAKYIASLVNAEYNIYSGKEESVTDDIVIVLGKDYIKK